MSAKYHFCWNELLSINVEADRKFYKEVFGWESEDKVFGETVYTIFQHQGQDIAGMIAAPEECKGASSSWLSYVTVDDVKLSLDVAIKAGGTIVMPVTAIDGVGEIAVALTPTNGAIGFFKPEKS